MKDSPYRAILGSAFESLHPHVQRAHLAPLSAHGTMTVDRGTHPLTPLLAQLLKLPGAGAGQPVELSVHAAKSGDLVWTRQIGSARLETRQISRGRRLVETNGVGSVAFDLIAEDGSLRYRQVSMRCAGLPLPGAVAPRVEASVSPTDSGWEVTVIVTWRGHLMCRYTGSMRQT